MLPSRPDFEIRTESRDSSGVLQCYFGVGVLLGGAVRKCRCRRVGVGLPQVALQDAARVPPFRSDFQVGTCSDFCMTE